MPRQGILITVSAILTWARWVVGADNFTLRFTTTRVYRKLKDLGYINIRYVEDNMLGVRFEPWHIKVSSKA